MAELTTAIFRNLIGDVRQMRLSLGRRWTTALLWAANFAVAGLILLPILYLFVRLVAAENSPWGTVFRATTLATLGNTLLLAAAVTLASAAIAIPIAWLTVRSDIPFRRLWAILAVLPLVIPSYVGAYLLTASLGPRGIIAHWLEAAFGFEQIPSIYGFAGAAYVLTLLSYPLTVLSVRSALQGIDPALEEASRSLGTGPWRTFCRVILPQLRPGIAAGSLLVALYVLRDFGAVSIMRYNTFTRVIYIQFQATFNREAAAALSLILVGLTVAILFFEARSQAGFRGRYHTQMPGSVRPHPPTALGGWRWPALLFCAVIVLLALVIPSGVLVYWLLRGIEMGHRVSPVWSAAWNSLSVSIAAALLTLLACLPVAYAGVRRPGKSSQILGRIAYLGYALPGVVVALSLVFFTVNLARPVYQTLFTLLIAYLILFLPQAIGAVRTSLLQVHPRLEEAGRGLGRGSLTVFSRITFPLLRPGIITALGLVFLTTMKELPATLILSPYDFKTLATEVWSTVSEAFFAQAAAPALLLILLSSVPMAILLFRERQ
ncbi:MAG TPA: iron ABC transporter permease [Anaerolineales bacterium]|nr:iron ABC transporter permease [Anaerolineales bacterium]